MQFPCRITRTLFQLFLGTVSLACFLSTVSGGLSKVSNNKVMTSYHVRILRNLL